MTHYLVRLPVVDHACHLFRVILAEIHSCNQNPDEDQTDKLCIAQTSGPPVEVGVVGAGPAHGRGVDDGRHLVEVVHQ